MFCEMKTYQYCVSGWGNMIRGREGVCLFRGVYLLERDGELSRSRR